MTRIVFEGVGIQELTRSLGMMETRAEDLRPWLSGFAEPLMLRSAQLNFVHQGRPNRWDELSERTIERRRNRDVGSIQILRDTGLLMQSLNPDRQNVHSIRRIGGDFAEVGTKRPGAEAHQEGSDRVPQRQFLLFQESDIEDLAQGAVDYIVDGLRAPEIRT